MRHGELLHLGSRGYTFVAVLLLVALVSLGLAVVGPMWSQQVKREREHDLLRIGSLYAQALENYREASPGTLKQYPPNLDALLSDSRFAGTMRHLRKVYADPVNPGHPWGLVRDDAGGIRGVYSLSTQPPLAQGTVTSMDVSLPAATRYSDWKFVAKVKS